MFPYPITYIILAFFIQILDECYKIIIRITVRTAKITWQNFIG